jgi:Flp pilus assembly protein TadG
MAKNLRLPGPPARAAAPARRGRRSAASRGRRAAAALEFAIVAIPFLVSVMGVFEVGYDLFVQVALDDAVEAAARGVQVGSNTGSSGESSAAFAAAAVCPAVSVLLNCARLTVAVAPVPSGYTYHSNPSPPTRAQASAAGGSICTGTGGQMMLITAWYAGPSFVGMLIPYFTTTINGAPSHLTSASAGFVNDYFAGGQTTGTGC